MAHSVYKVSVPGSLMLMGEHAILNGYAGLVTAINKRLTTTAIPRQDRQIRVQSVLGTANWSLDALPSHSPVFSFVLAAVKIVSAHVKRGMDLYIETAFSDQLGLGSSAAVVVSIIAALLYAETGKHPTTETLLLLSCTVIRQVQGFGSGADAAASILGGVVLHTPGRDSVIIGKSLPLVVVYSGSKEKTTQVVKQVEARIKAQPRMINSIFEAIQQGTLEAVQAIKEKDWLALGEIVNAQQGLMNALGVSNLILETVIYHLREAPGILGAKISGSGLGDCVLAIGDPLPEGAVSLAANQFVLPVAVSPEGIQYA